MATYMIWEGFIESLDKKMKTIGNKCRKYGIDFIYRQTGKDEYRDIKGSDGEFHTLRYVEIEAEGRAMMGGWEWLASVERTDKGNLIHSARDVEVPNKYYTSECYCEHCNTRRWRRSVHLVRNIKTGEIKQVGNSCLRDYTHGLSAEMVAAYKSFLTGLEEAEEEIPSGGSGGFGKIEYFDPLVVTQFMVETIRHFGFVPKNDDDKLPTSVRAGLYYDVWYGRTSGLEQRKIDEIWNEMRRVGFDPDRPETVNEAREALAWIAEQDDSKSTYIHNLKLVCEMERVRSWHYGILASLIPTWNKSLVREAERKAQEAAESNSRFIGNVGDRITFDVHSAKVVSSWETDYGTTWLIKFVSTDGNVFMWKASSLHSLPDDFEEIKKITGTVKDHSEFRGVKQTLLNRCKVA